MARATASISALTKFNVIGSPGFTLGLLASGGAVCARENELKMPPPLIPIDKAAIKNDNFFLLRVGRVVMGSSNLDQGARTLAAPQYVEQVCQCLFAARAGLCVALKAQPPGHPLALALQQQRAFAGGE